MRQALSYIKGDLPWTERLDLTLDPLPAPKPLEELQNIGASSREDIHDDFKREMLLYVHVAFTLKLTFRILSQLHLRIHTEVTVL